jgi:FKBP12-rapamycin complex-associated protein
MAVPISERSHTSNIIFQLTIHSTLVRAQMLSELEEIIVYKQYADQPERQQAMRKTWMKRYDLRSLLQSPDSQSIRLQGCQPDVETWQRVLQVRALVLNPEDDPVMWIKFANLCRKSDRMALAEKTINSLLSPERVRHGIQQIVACALM